MMVLRECVNDDGQIAVKQLGVNNYLRDNDILALMNNADICRPEVQAAIEKCEQNRAAAETLSRFFQNKKKLMEAKRQVNFIF